MEASNSENGLALAAQRCSVGEMECECGSDTFQVLKAGDDGSDPNVICRLGMCYHYGWGTDKDLKAAVQCYVRAAELGSFEALELLQNLCNDQSVKANLQNAFSGFCEKADLGDAISQFNAGFCYFEGIGTPLNKAKARDLFQKAADQGCADAMWMLDCCRQRRLGDGYNGMQGIGLLKYAAEIGSSKAQNELGYAYYYGKRTTYGLEVEQDYKQAAEWYRKAADQNHTEATHYLACCYYDGEDVQLDVKKAFQLWNKAALMGNANAHNSISDFYSHQKSGFAEDEWPVGLDYYEAVYQNRKAADQCSYSANKRMPNTLKAIGLTQDQIDKLKKQTSSFESAITWYNIAKQYETADGVEQDEKKAFKMYWLAAKLGSIPAKTVLGRYYEQGIGTDVDTQQATHWYEKATKQGHNEAAKSLLSLIQSESTTNGLKTESPFAALAECYQTGSGVTKNEDTALLMREHAAAKGDIQQAKIVIESYISGNGNENRIRAVGYIVARMPGLSREVYQQFIELFNDSIDDLDKMQILQHIAAAIRVESMGINFFFE